MNFSGKVTNSAIVYLRGQGAELATLMEPSDIPFEFLRDPTSWLEARKVEEILEHIENWASSKYSMERPLEKMGHAAKDLKAWGVLDSVLRMIAKPQDIFLQPQRFISYFISPAPPIANIQRGDQTVSFDLPISFEEFPRVATYLRAAIEAVPLFMGAQMAEARWHQNRVTISWNQSQPLLLDDADLDQRHMAPEVMQNLISNLEKTELALLEKTRELEKIKSENALAAQSRTTALEELRNVAGVDTSNLQQRIMKLQDYFTRSQQLITLLVGQDRLSPQVREAMRRVNWEQTQKSFAETAQELLEQTENTVPFQLEKEYGQDFQSTSPRDSRQPWLPHN